MVCFGSEHLLKQ